jgi:hypothetical protein
MPAELVSTSGGQPAEDLDSVAIGEVLPLSRIMNESERLLLCRLHADLIRSLHGDHETAVAADDGGRTLRTFRIYAFLRALTGDPLRAGTTREPKTIANRQLQEIMRNGYADRLGDPYRATEKGNVPEGLKHRIDKVV